MLATSLFPGAVLLVGTILVAQPSVDLPRLFPRAAHAVGIPQVRFDAPQNAYLLTLRDVHGRVLVEYRLPLDHGNVRRGLLRIEETTTGVVPVAAGGLSYRTAGVPAAGLGRLISPVDLAFHATHDPNHTATILAHGIDTGGTRVFLRIRDEYRAGSATYRTEKSFGLALFGRALKITATADASVRDEADFNYAGFQFGDGEGLPAGGQALHIPFMDLIPVFAANGVYVTRFIDWYQSSASESPGTAPQVIGDRFRGETSSATYRDDRGKLLAPIHDVGYVVVTDRVADTFVVIDRPPSEYRLLTAERALSQNAPGNRYDKAGDWVRRAAECGIDDMHHIKWDWSKWPFNLNDPDYLPAPPAPPFGNLWGAPSEWLAFARVTADANWGLAPYFAANMMDPGYPNLTLQLPGSAVGSVLLTANPAYDAAQCTRDASGGFKLGWDTNLNLANSNLQGQGHRVHVASPSGYEARFAAIARGIQAPGGFPTGGAHVDAQTDIPGWIEIDQQAASPRAKTIAANLRQREFTFQALKDGMAGPLLGENSHWRYRAFETYAAGLLDGTSRKIPIHWSPAEGPPNATNWDAPVIPDFELGVVVPQASAWFGMGWETHFKGSGFPVWQAWSDAWHTTLLSYGHAPYFGTNGDVTNNYWSWRDTLRSYHLTRGLAAALRRVPLAAVRYVDDQMRERSLDEALVQGLDLAHPRLVIRLVDGTEFKANHAPTPWTTTVLSRSWTLPPDGFAGASPNGRLAVSALHPTTGQRVDYALEPGVVEVIDRRGVAQQLDGFPGALLPVPGGLFPPATDDRQMVIVHDRRRNQVVYATGFLTARRALGAAPSLVSLRIATDGPPTLSLGRLRLGLRAIAKDSTGAERDVTGLVGWTSAQPGIAEVGRWGAVRPRGPGQVSITATLPATPTLIASQTVDVTANPVLGELVVLANARPATLVAFTADSRAALAAVFVERVGGGWSGWVIADPDPVAKRHTAVLAGLSPATAYDVTPAVLNEIGLAAVGTRVRIVVP